MALTITTHGGGCCGVRHIKNFSQWTRSVYNQVTGRYELKKPEPITAEVLEGMINGQRDPETGRNRGVNYINPRPGAKGHNGGRTRGKLVEAIVTDAQFRHDPGLAQALKDAGFKLVTRFSNNTGGMCNVLHRVTGGRDISMAARRNPHVRTLISD